MQHPHRSETILRTMGKVTVLAVSEDEPITVLIRCSRCGRNSTRPYLKLRERFRILHGDLDCGCLKKEQGKLQPPPSPRSIQRMGMVPLPAEEESGETTRKSPKATKTGKGTIS